MYINLNFKKALNCKNISKNTFSLYKKMIYENTLAYSWKL